MGDDATVIYADILFLINFCVDYLCLFITCRLIGRVMRTWRILCGALLGALYSFVPYIFSLSEAWLAVLHITALLLMTWISLGIRPAERFVLASAALFGCEAMLGGCVTGLINLSGKGFFGMSVWTLVTALAVSGGVTLIYFEICRKKLRTKSARVRIKLPGASVDTLLLIDSGNLVTEPFSALPVIILSSSVLPPPYDMPSPDMYPLPLRAIPFRTSTSGSNMLGFLAREAYVTELGKKPRKIDAYIGIDTHNKSFSGYDGLMPSCLL